MVVSVPTKLDNDHTEIMTIAVAAQDCGGNLGCAMVDDVQQKLRLEMGDRSCQKCYIITT